MKLIFMGTPEFALPSLEKLFNSRYEVAAVVTAPDKERGRGQKVTFHQIKEFALKKNIPLFQPEKLKDENFIKKLKEINADLFVVVAFRILPEDVFALPPKGSFNLHASLLPKYRGAAPIQWALINGEKETGVTTFALEKKVDTGNIFLQEKIEILPEDNFSSLHDKLSMLGSEVVLKTADLIDSGDYSLKPQPHGVATPAPKITKETGKINWENSAEDIINLIRGLSTYPGAYFFYEGKQIKIFWAKLSDKKLSPGEILSSKSEIIIGCGTGAIEILELQQEGRKRMKSEEYLRGFSFS